MHAHVLSDDEIDDILYFTRTNDASELDSSLSSLAHEQKCSKAEILVAARDPESGNTVAHFAAANGFDGLMLFATFTTNNACSLYTDLLRWLIMLITPTTATEESASSEASAATQNGTEVMRPTPPILLTMANTSGSTPLHYAATTGQLECAKILVEAGVDVRVKNQMGHTAMYEAEVGGKDTIVKYLLDMDVVIGDEGDGAEDAQENGGESVAVAANAAEDAQQNGGEDTAAATNVAKIEDSGVEDSGEGIRRGMEDLKLEKPQI
ncbi:MAG: hypothetical protein M1820_006237 [Bogoriella megaspora]|nr:MAG: hypothetical protein M1820_006237 [Bogoriella megaspora]